jgi:hypothetical protein
MHQVTRVLRRASCHARILQGWWPAAATQPRKILYAAALWINYCAKRSATVEDIMLMLKPRIDSHTLLGLITLSHTFC